MARTSPGTFPPPRRPGIRVEDYDSPGLKTEDGIADIDFAWAAWIIDPATNALGILQIKE